MTNTVFRAATESDVPRLMPLIEALATEDGAPGFLARPAEAALRQLLVDPTLGEAWVIETGNDISGYVVITWGFSLEFHGRDAFVDELYIVPAHRGQGIGQRAIEHAAARCRAQGIGAVHLEVEPSNERARSLYGRSGFKERGYRLMSRRLA